MTDIYLTLKHYECISLLDPSLLKKNFTFFSRKKNNYYKKPEEQNSTKNEAPKRVIRRKYQKHKHEKSYVNKILFFSRSKNIVQTILINVHR